MKRIKLLVWADQVVETGFARVAHSIVKYLPRNYDVVAIGVNYYGDPHNYPYKIYPASTNGDIYGIKRVEDIVKHEQPDVIFIINDAWIQQPMLDKLKEIYKDKELPRIVTYTPVDAAEHDSDWYKPFDVVSVPVAYTEFGKREMIKASPQLEDRIKIVPHGIDQKVFFKVSRPKEDLKRMIYPDKDEFINSFIVLSASRNQPRKRLDIAMEGFKMFAENKPANVKIYMHCGVVDSAINIPKMAQRLAIGGRLLLTSLTTGVQRIPAERLNLIYNATDVGINTGVGEGFSLTNIEHAITGAPQVVADHSALQELYYDCGLLIPTKMNYTLDNIMTVGKLVRPEDVAEKLELLYNNKDLYNTLAEQGLKKFSSPEYSWQEISKTWAEIFEG
jgi:glycosyltransferase involved in cell wall biosynthesis